MTKVSSCWVRLDVAIMYMCMYNQTDIDVQLVEATCIWKKKNLSIKFLLRFYVSK